MNKLLIASDIHGSAFYCEALMRRIDAERPDKVLLLGDLLYHGPRNDLPKDYAPKEVIPMLNSLKGRVLAVRGNCDTEVDQMVLEFPILADYAVLSLGNKTVYASHGHVYGEKNPMPLSEGDILLCGHTHVPACNHHEGFSYLNCGSVSIPKEDSRHSYMTWQDGMFSWCDVMTGESYHVASPVIRSAV